MAALHSGVSEYFHKRLSETVTFASDAERVWLVASKPGTGPLCNKANSRATQVGQCFHPDKKWHCTILAASWKLRVSTPFSTPARMRVLHDISMLH